MRASLHFLAIIFCPILVAASAVPVETDEGYAVPQPGHVFSFPRDHASHPAFKIEWWYLTGHLESAAGERFGFQATFFRNALRPPSDQVHDGGRGGPAFGEDHVFLAHMALTAVERDQFFHEERLNRNGWRAWAETERLDLANGNWTLRAKGSNEAMQLAYTVGDEVTVDLRLEPQKPLLRFGEDGTSRKGPDPTARSYYLTWSRLAAEGSVQLGEERLAVTGSAWMDHEIASQQLSDALAGWDWLAVQFDDGWDLKAYILRRADGTPDAFSALMWIGPDGEVTYRTVDDFSWEATRWWTSPETGARYPIELAITTADPTNGRPTTVKVLPLLDQQELTSASGGIEYWEGACRVITEAEGTTARQGRAYLELVGYAESIEGQLK